MPLPHQIRCKSRSSSATLPHRPRNLDLPAAWDLQWGVRPDAASLVHELASNTTSPPVPEAGDIEKTPSSPEHERACSSSTAAVIVCGPTGMVEDASNAAVRRGRLCRHGYSMAVAGGSGSQSLGLTRSGVARALACLRPLA
ncbi:hypothetical protein L1887_51211 [Cichorium endivia]|nr:hypothetical protein L1887_51211 [Cichorium endivia]